MPNKEFRRKSPSRSKSCARAFQIANVVPVIGVVKEYLEVGQFTYDFLVVTLGVRIRKLNLQKRRDSWISSATAIVSIQTDTIDLRDQRNSQAQPLCLAELDCTFMLEARFSLRLHNSHKL